MAIGFRGTALLPPTHYTVTDTDIQLKHKVISGVTSNNDTQSQLPPGSIKLLSLYKFTVFYAALPVSIQRKVSKV